MTPNGVFLVGGYDGHAPRREIYRTTDGTHFAVVATLPVGLRYAAVNAVGSTVYIAGGGRVLALDTGTDALRTVAAANVPRGQAAFALGADVFLGGYWVAPGGIRRVGLTLPAYAGTAVLGGAAWIVGGESGGATTVSVRRVAGRG